MGYMRHHAILVSSWNRARIDTAWEVASSIFNEVQVSPILGTTVNEYYTFGIGPDGSKEGWGASNEGDAERAAFIKWLEYERDEEGGSYYKWVEVQYGDDEGVTCIVNDSDAYWRSRKQPETSE